MSVAKQTITYVTGNKMKMDYMVKFLKGTEFEVVQIKMDCPEIQSDSIEEVAKFSAKWASDYLKADVLKNDSGLVIPALNGFPSAYTKYVEQTLKSDGILALMQGKTNREAYYLDAFAYCEYGKEPVVFTTKSYGKIHTQESGDNHSHLDRIFIPKGKEVTLANMSYEEFLSCFDDAGASKLVEYLTAKN